jgi:Protein of unknown function (DUF3795)
MNERFEVEMRDPTYEPGLLIAPCGMNCGICIGFLREKNKCPGCNSDSENKQKHCTKCVIRNCEYLEESTSGFCYECPKYPCPRLKQLDKRYRTRYHMSMIENLNNIKALGLDEFLVQEKLNWTCPACKAVRSVHRENCLVCGKKVFL